MQNITRIELKKLKQNMFELSSFISFLLITRRLHRFIHFGIEKLSINKNSKAYKII